MSVLVDGLSLVVDPRALGHILHSLLLFRTWESLLITEIENGVDHTEEKNGLMADDLTPEKITVFEVLSKMFQNVKGLTSTIATCE